jgi:hypothetical protein
MKQSQTREPEDAGRSPEAISSPLSTEGHTRSGSTKQDFKFPTSTPSDNGSPKLPDSSDGQKLKRNIKAQESVISPSSIEVPPPPPVEKERSNSTVDDGEDDFGDTVEVPLNYYMVAAQMYYGYWFF